MEHSNAMTSYTISTQGKRSANQDRSCVECCVIAGEQATVAAVADGMGGMKRGDRAAEIAIATVKEFVARVFPALPSSSPGDMKTALNDLFHEANRRILETWAGEDTKEETGTTLVCCLALGNRYFVANAGDSRCYMICTSGVKQITEDHNQAMDLVRQGIISGEAAARSPLRNQLTNSLGTPKELKVDVFPKEGEGTLKEACVLMLCTDGLHAFVSEEDIHNYLDEPPGLAAACDALVALSLERGTTDNVTIAAIRTSSFPTPASPAPVP